MLTTAEQIFQVTVDDTMTGLSQKMNNAMKHFSAIATIFLPLNLVAGLFGMNVLVPG
jgi:Mg2+ and Co2+ transporter CorA